MKSGDHIFTISVAKDHVSAIAMPAAILSFGLVVPQHVSGEAVGHSYSSSITQVVTGMRLHRLETSWLTQLVGMLLMLNLLAAGLRSALRLSDSNESNPARSPVAHTKIALPESQPRLDEWLSRTWPRSGARLKSSNQATGRIEFDRISSASPRRGYHFSTAVITAHKQILAHTARRRR